jgi:hypothetical protein
VKHGKEVMVLQRDGTKSRNGSRKLEIKWVVGELSRNKVVADRQTRGRNKRKRISSRESKGRESQKRAVFIGP